jgi:hypothetical protein
MSLIGIAGAARSGKDTAGLHLCQHFGFRRYSFAGPLKDMLLGMGLQPADLDAYKDLPLTWLGITPRRLMQTLGTEWGRAVDPDLWVKLMDRNLKFDWRLGRHQVITDVRFDNEAAYIRANGGLLIHLRRTSAGSVEAHSSEAGLPVLAGDVLIDNDGPLHQLYDQLTEIVSRYLFTRFTEGLSDETPDRAQRP